jgi:hypothetical protein
MMCLCNGLRGPNDVDLTHSDERSTWPRLLPRGRCPQCPMRSRHTFVDLGHFVSALHRSVFAQRCLQRIERGCTPARNIEPTLCTGRAATRRLRGHRDRRCPGVRPDLPERRLVAGRPIPSAVLTATLCLRASGVDRWPCRSYPPAARLRGLLARNVVVVEHVGLDLADRNVGEAGIGEHRGGQLVPPTRAQSRTVESKRDAHAVHGRHGVQV